MLRTKKFKIKENDIEEEQLNETITNSNPGTG